MIRKTHTEVTYSVINHRATLSIDGAWHCVPIDLTYIAQVIARDMQRAIALSDDVWFTTMLEF